MKIYELKNKIRDYNEEMKDLSNKIVEYAENRDAEGVKRTQSEIEALKVSRNALTERLEEIESQERAKAERNEEMSNEDAIIRDTATFFRNIAAKKPVSKEIQRNLLGDNVSASGGENLLPTQLSNTLVHKPFDRNPLRQVMQMTNITGLEIPKVAFSISDDAFITDGASAKEGTLTGDKVSFGRYKFKISARVSDTIINGTDTNLVQYIQNVLSAGLAQKEKKQILGTSPESGTEHMNLYHSSNSIKEVEGEDLYTAIINALADLPEDYSANASIVMKKSDYYAIIRTLSNGNTNLYMAQPSQVFGYPVIFCDLAEKPVIGDFSYLHLNYENPITFKADEKIETGDVLFVLTAWADIRIIMADAFRIAKDTAVLSLATKAAKVKNGI